MTRDLRHLPWAQVLVELFSELLALLRERLEFIRDVDRGLVLHKAQFLNFGL